MIEYKVCKDAVLAKCTGIWNGWEPVSSLDELKTYANKDKGDIVIGATWAGPKFPKDLAAKVLACITKFPHREIEFMMYFDLIKQEWHIKVPSQRGSGASVSYMDDAKGLPDGCVVIGTIHTHPEMSAFWSGTDMNDQKDKHGLHIVFGTRDGYPAQWKVTRFFPGGSRDLELLDVWEELPKKEDLPEPPADWMEVLNKPLPEPVSRFQYAGSRSNWSLGGNTYTYSGSYPHTYSYGGTVGGAQRPATRYAYEYPYDADAELDWQHYNTKKPASAAKRGETSTYYEASMGESMRDALSGVIGMAIDTVGYEGIVEALQEALDAQGLDVLVGDPESVVLQGMDILDERGELENVLQTYGIEAPTFVTEEEAEEAEAEETELGCKPVTSADQPKEALAIVPYPNYSHKMPEAMTC